MHRSSLSLIVCLTLPAMLFITLHTAMAIESDVGPLDRPVLLPGDDNRGMSSSQAPALDAGNNPIQSQAQLRTAVKQEQEELEQLPKDQLEARAEQGERLAQVVLGADFAQEATLLPYSPAAANDALSDAMRWYLEAAGRGFPGAPSLDQAGVQSYPIRIHRQ